MERLWQPTASHPRLPVVDGGPPFVVGRVWCVGRNYGAHTREMGGDPVKESPFFFLKPSSSVVVEPAGVLYPPMTAELHHEVELYVALGAGGVDLSLADASQAIVGYGAAVDLTRRDVQRVAKSKGRPWALAKGFDAAAPLSLLTLGPPPAALALSLQVNGEVRQRGVTSEMKRSVAELIRELSLQVRVLPGDVILTGTPAGVGPVVPGDRLEARVGACSLQFEVLEPRPGG